MESYKLEECPSCGDEPLNNTGEEYCPDCNKGDSRYLDQ